MGLYRWLVKVSWLGKLVSVFWWVELYFFSLEPNYQMHLEILCCLVLSMPLASSLNGANWMNTQRHRELSWSQLVSDGAAPGARMGLGE